jgi:hypothetical protein
MTFHKLAILAWSAVVALVLLSLVVRAWVGGTGDDVSSVKAAPPIPQLPKITPLKDYIPFYAQLSDGRLMGISERTVEGVHQAIARYSTDDGISWSEAETLFRLPKDNGEWGISNILLDHDGELHFFYTLTYTVGQSKGIYDMRIDVWHVRSTNARKNWKAPQPLWKGYYGSMNSVIQLRSGRIVLPLSVLTPRTWGTPGAGFDAFTDVGRFSSKVGYSDDGGESWHLSPVEFKTSMPYIGADGMIEPIVIQLKDGRVWMLIRTPNGRFYESLSKDGAEWSRPQPTEIFSSDSPAALVRLKDGRIVMFWNNCLRYPYAQGGRFVIHAAISEDEGKTWRGYREVASDPRVDTPHPPEGDYGVSYIWPVVTQNQKILFNSTAWPRPDAPAPALVHVDPEWLYATDRKTDFSAGLRDWFDFGTKGVEVVPSPQKPGIQVLELHKPLADWPAAAVWNFPMGRRGHLRIRTLLNSGFAGARLGLTDHFSVPFDPEDGIYNLYNLEIGPNGDLADGKRLDPGRWHELEFDWDDAQRECRVTLDGNPVTTLRLTREAASGVSYLRLVSTAEQTDTAGLLVESVAADVSDSWGR